MIIRGPWRSRRWVGYVPEDASEEFAGIPCAAFADDVRVGFPLESEFGGGGNDGSVIRGEDNPCERMGEVFFVECGLQKVVDLACDDRF